MKDNFKILFFIALTTGIGVICFQLYWLYNAYRLQETEFITTATHALQRSNDKYIRSSVSLERVEHAVVTFRMEPQKAGTHKETLSKQLAAKLRAGLKDSLFKKAQTQQTQQFPSTAFEDMSARLFAQLINKSYHKDTLSKIYEQELALGGIRLPFSLNFLGSRIAKSKYGISIQTGLSKGTVSIEAKFLGKQRYVLAHTLVPIVISLILMFLTAGCLWYMWRIIQRQRQLSDIKNDFINNMTHELKTPISILKTTHEALYKFGEVGNKEKTLRYLQLNLTELDKLQQRVDRILDINLYETGKKKINTAQFNLKQLITEIIERFEINEAHNISLSYHLREEEIISDQYSIDTIVTNLLDNALKYSDKKFTEISIVLSRTEADQLLLSISDNGPGIPTAQLPFIFDKFYRAPTGNVHNVKGYGLGLSYVKELVTVLNGTIKVQPVAAGGTKFIIQIPIWKI